MKKRESHPLKKTEPKNIQSVLMFVLMLLSMSIMLFLEAVMYMSFSGITRQETTENTWKLMRQTGESLEDYLGNMRQTADAVYYNVVKENDFSGEMQEIQRGMNLLYEANKDSLRSIAIYNDYGSLLAAEPVATQKEDPDVTRQEWFKSAMGEIENMHFSTPHIQNLFDDATFHYYWVVSLSRMIEITENGMSRQGVLLVDMDYSGISRMMNQLNRSAGGTYYYLCDSSGNIIYHPRQIQLSDGICREDSRKVAGLKDGVHDESFEGERRRVIVDTVSYTGWKLVGVIPNAAFAHGMANIRYFVILTMLLTVMLLLTINRLISRWVSGPILKLNDSVMKYKGKDNDPIYIGGPSEIRRLGESIQASYEQNERLMEKVVTEQNQRRRSELAVLQNQINPHFLYNTLESITWMIESRRNEEAAFMISQLAKLFRISLSKGRTVISVKEELQHAQSYMNIQKVRYKNTFSLLFDIDERIEQYCTVKLILQPILENAINYGMNGVEDCGRILVTGKEKNGTVTLAVEDNGLGMTEAQARLILTEDGQAHTKGSGVGLANVNNRIQMVFGKEYGVSLESKQDKGTTVFLRFPAVPYTEENRETLERGGLR